jgi:hypothetical protein
MAGVASVPSFALATEAPTGAAARTTTWPLFHEKVARSRFGQSITDCEKKILCRRRQTRRYPLEVARWLSRRGEGSRMNLPGELRKTSRWPTADKSAPGPRRTSFALASSPGQGRTGPVKCGQNLLLSPLVRQRSRSEFGGVAWTNADKMETVG